MEVASLALPDAINWVREHLTAAVPLKDVFREVLDLSYTDIAFPMELSLSREEYQKIVCAVERLNKKEPLAHIVGHAPFYGRDFYVNEDVLIPRMDTEISIEVLLKLFKEGDRFLELGVGSGCVSLTLALEGPPGAFHGVDISPEALAVAEKNLGKFQGELHSPVTFFQSDWFSALEGKYQLIYANPPYISYGELDDLDESVKDYEPHLALFAPENGLANYRKIVQDSPNYLKNGGHLVFEIGATQGKAVAELLETRGFTDVAIERDLEQRDRVVYGTWISPDGGEDRI
ncbi:MAG: peptide chain release factor N(5)-glutamine methyltransferase [Tissierellia bacterium]|nr:peptide chain release factor N(5)-glutamine methyltransferase [Tissierellia bacterium]